MRDVLCPMGLAGQPSVDSANLMVARRIFHVDGICSVILCFWLMIPLGLLHGPMNLSGFLCMCFCSSQLELFRSLNSQCPHSYFIMTE